MRAARTGRGPGPSRSGLLVLALASFALIATSPAPPRLEASAIGEVEIAGDGPIDHVVRLRLGPGVVDGAVHGEIDATFLAASGLDVGYSTSATITIDRADRPGDPSEFGGAALPLTECLEGCELEYVVRVWPTTAVMPGSTARYRVDLAIQYEGYAGGRSSSVAIDVERLASGPPPAWWAVLAGMVAVIVGWGWATSIDRVLGRRRRWPAIFLASLPILTVVILVAQRAAEAMQLGVDLVTVSLYLADPWSLGLLAILVWGVVRGIRRWGADGGWSLGLGALAMTGLGGLWLVWRATLEPVGQPIVAALAAVLLGILAGTVVGQGWRTDPRAAHDRLPAGAAVLAHGIVIAGFAHLAANALYDPFATVPGGLAPLIPAGLIALALWRWFQGGRALLVLFDLIVAVVGLLGLWIVVLPQDSLFSVGPEPIGDVAIVIAVGAALVGLVTALHRMPGPQAPAPVPSSEPPVATPPTT
ncbi:MAG TPA: hypothetical protein VF119_04135 [Candidatus Limnocylindrales bacterium]